MSKLQPNGIVPGGSQFGTTFEKSSPAVFRNTGKAQKKKGDGTDTIECGPYGVTFERAPAGLNFPGKEAHARDNKEIASSSGTEKMSDTASDLTASKSGSGEPSSAPYTLGREYEKSGRSDSKRARR